MQTDLAELDEITTLGLELFGNQIKFQLWLATKNYALGNVTPSSLLGNSQDRELVVRELTNISHGIFA